MNSNTNITPTKQNASSPQISTTPSPNTPTKNKGRFIVICIEGCHGSGKTSIVSWFKKLGFTVLDEGFMQESKLMHPQSFTMEFGWIWNWFNRLMKIRSKHMEKDMVVIADRSPYSAVFYSRGDAGHKMQDSIHHMVQEVRQVGIDIYTVKVHVDKGTLFRRIALRLEREPQRANYNEDKSDWNAHIYKKYQEFTHWDMVLDNSEDRKIFVELVHSVIQQVQQKTPFDMDLLQVGNRCREFLRLSPAKTLVSTTPTKMEDIDAQSETM